MDIHRVLYCRNKLVLIKYTRLAVLKLFIIWCFVIIYFIFFLCDEFELTALHLIIVSHIKMQQWGTILELLCHKCLSVHLHQICSLSPILIEVFSSNLAHMFSSVVQNLCCSCVVSISRSHLKVKGIIRVLLTLSESSSFVYVNLIIPRA